MDPANERSETIIAVREEAAVGNIERFTLLVPVLVELRISC